jgi:tripartite-type tricarboxylate transporter receptor subunit TctC
MTMNRRTLLAAGAIGTIPLTVPWARAQSVPDTAKIFAGFAAGGTVDITARRVADKLRDVIAKSVVVENRTGAGGQLALIALKSAPADGLTLAVTPMSMLGIYPHTYKKLAYDAQADFIPVSQAVRFDFGVAVGPMVPASVRTPSDYAAWCKANPANASFGSPAAGSVPHFVGELFGRAAGLNDYRHVAYRGTQPAILDLMGGQISAVCGPVGEFLQHLPTGKARLIATSGKVRNRFASNVATFLEQGFSELAFEEWFGFFVPARTPPDIVSRLSSGIQSALAAKDVIDSLALMGLESKSSTPAELASLLKDDTERWRPIVKSIGFTAES